MNLKKELRDWKRLMQSVPAAVVAFFTVSVILMNLLASKEIATGLSWLALACGFTVSWHDYQEIRAQSIYSVVVVRSCDEPGCVCGDEAGVPYPG